MYKWNTLHGLLCSNIFNTASAQTSTGVSSIACVNMYFGKAPISTKDFILLAKALSLMFIWNFPSEYLLVIFPILKSWASNPLLTASSTAISALNLVVVYIPFIFWPTYRFSHWIFLSLLLQDYSKILLFLQIQKRSL